MRSGNPLNDHGQRAIVLALVFESVLADEDGMGVSAPVPNQSRAGLHHDTGIEQNAGFARACDQVVQPPPQRPARPAMGALLLSLGQFGNFNFNLGQVLPSISVVPVAAPTENGRRPASACATPLLTERGRKKAR